MNYDPRIRAISMKGHSRLKTHRLLLLFSVIGNCLFAYGRKLGELCRRDADCESGLVCDVSAVGGASVCRAPMVIAKQYAEDCATSSDCDITRQVIKWFLRLLGIDFHLASMKKLWASISEKDFCPYLLKKTFAELSKSWPIWKIAVSMEIFLHHYLFLSSSRLNSSFAIYQCKMRHCARIKLH